MEHISTTMEITVKKLNDKKLQDKIKWHPFPAQKKILDCYDGVRDIRLAAGTRFGKSALCAYLALRELLKSNRHIWIVAPSYDLADRILEHLTVLIGTGFPLMAGGISRRIPQEIRNPARNSWIRFKSADNPASLLGEELDLVIMDECSRIKREVWESYIFQRLSSRKGKSIMISTPFGRNWFYEEWMKAKNAEDGMAFQFNTKTNPHFSEEEWERAKKLLPHQIFQQEYEASFLPDAAAVFRGIDEIVEDCLTDVVPEHYYVMGVDLAKHEDFTVLTVIDTETKKVVYIDRFRTIEYPFQRERIIATAGRYNNARVVVDSTGVGQSIKDDLERDGLFVDDFCFSTKSKKELVEKLSIFIEQRYIRIPNDTILTDELKAYGYKLTDAGNIKYSAPSGLHDDCVMSLALAVWALNPGNANQTNLLKKEITKRAKRPTASYI